LATTYCRRLFNTTSTQLYIGNGPWIYALDFNSGNEIWSTKLSGLHTNIIYIYAIDEALHLAATDETYYHFLDIESGKELDRSQFFTQIPAGLLKDIPSITEDKIFFGVGKNIVNFASAHQLYPCCSELWGTKEKNVISNVTASDKVAYFITFNDELRMVDVILEKS